MSDIIETKQDIVDLLNGIPYEQKITFTVDGVEHEAELQVYGGDVESLKVEVCLNPIETTMKENKVESGSHWCPSCGIGLVPIEDNDCPDCRGEMS